MLEFKLFKNKLLHCGILQNGFFSKGSPKYFYFDS